MLLGTHTERYPPLDWAHIKAIHNASEQAIRDMRSEDVWTTKVVIPVLQEGLRSRVLEAHQV
jgi:hypothetical protein